MSFCLSQQVGSDHHGAINPGTVTDTEALCWRSCLQRTMPSSEGEMVHPGVPSLPGPLEPGAHSPVGSLANWAWKDPEAAAVLVTVSTLSLSLGSQAIAPKKEDGSGAVRIISF